MPLMLLHAPPSAPPVKAARKPQELAEVASYASRKAEERGESLRRAENERPWVKTVNLTVERKDGSWVRSDGNILVPGNWRDFETWAKDPYMSGDDQILISATAVILASVARENGWVDPKVSAGILTGVKILTVVWISLYWGVDYLVYAPQV